MNEFSELYKRNRNITQLTQLKESLNLSWEQIANKIYTILEDTDAEDRINTIETFQKSLQKIQLKRHQLLSESYDNLWKSYWITSSGEFIEGDTDSSMGDHYGILFASGKIAQKLGVTNPEWLKIGKELYNAAPDTDEEWDRVTELQEIVFTDIAQYIIQRNARVGLHKNELYIQSQAEGKNQLWLETLQKHQEKFPNVNQVNWEIDRWYEIPAKDFWAMNKVKELRRYLSESITPMDIVTKMDDSVEETKTVTRLDVVAQEMFGMDFEELNDYDLQKAVQDQLKLKDYKPSRKFTKDDIFTESKVNEDQESVELPLSNTDKKTIIDKEDLSRVLRHSWFLATDKRTQTHYVVTKKRDGKTVRTIRLNRYIMHNPSVEFDVHHKNLNPLDNRKENLQVILHDLHIGHAKDKDFSGPEYDMKYAPDFAAGIEESITEEVTLDDPEVLMKEEHAEIANTELQNSTWAGEQTWKKFWLLTDGTIIPVYHAHWDTASDAKVKYDELREAGAIAGVVEDKEKSLTLRYEPPIEEMTVDQVIAAKKLWDKYDLKKVYTDAGTAIIGNTRELSNYLNHGINPRRKEFESVNNPEQNMKSKYQNILNKELAPTTYQDSSEEGWMKFWLLTDGTLVPVDFSHEKSASNAGTSYEDLIDVKAIPGFVLVSQGAISLRIAPLYEQPNHEQMLAINNLWKKHDLNQVWTNAERVKIKSDRELSRYLRTGTKPTQREWESKINESLTEFAKEELKLAGLFDKDSDYDGMIGEAVMELMTTFANQGHSGFSAGMVTEIFQKLAGHKPLSELTDRSSEWMFITDKDRLHPSEREMPLWQSRRNPGCFSHDGGKTYYDLDDKANEGKDKIDWKLYPSKHVEMNEDLANLSDPKLKKWFIQDKIDDINAKIKDLEKLSKQEKKGYTRSSIFSKIDELEAEKTRLLRSIE